MKDKITLAEAFLILKNKENELDEVLTSRFACLQNTYKKVNGQKELMHEPHEISVNELTSKSEILMKEIRKLRLIVAKANLKTLVEFTIDGEKISLQEAIYLVKQYRNELPRLKQMGEMRSHSEIVDPTPRYTPQVSGGIDRSYEQVMEPSFDTKEYRKKAEKMEVLITKLEVAINQANYSIFVDLDGIEVKQI
ncbi:hypothetical protein KQI88_06915 [Alkaliphilus sp. MSJ-5]|uniref:Uncharacterized protein n=1 Tax=Alkaliphilus flagellatus TaxID=2841507 RepID=A0ABS6G1S6_9FIRM|nr:hypothetical protein [Alkaliphilus flagellatus]MBU5676144.1 hypothetical protein [Alkaliphilus flagellatus]